MSVVGETVGDVQLVGPEENYFFTSSPCKARASILILCMHYVRTASFTVPISSL